VQLRFANRSAREPRSVDVLVFSETFEEPDRLIIGIVIARALVQRLPDDLHARPHDEPGVDGIPQVNGVEAATRIHVEHRREAGFEIDLRVRQRNQRALGGRVAAGVHVHVGVDHPRQDGRRAEVDNPGAARNLHGGTDIRDPVALDQNDLVVLKRPGLRIEEPAGADRDFLIGRCSKSALLRRDGTCGANQRDNGSTNQESSHCILLRREDINRDPDSRPRACVLAPMRRRAPFGKPFARIRHHVGLCRPGGTSSGPAAGR
jgi:hypothetical protein